MLETTPTLTLLPPTPSPIPQSPTPSPTPELPCLPQACAYSGHFWLERPILPTDYDHIDSTYRYGSTQEGARPTHHGVEFVNPEGTAVLAAAEGLVIVAGTDFQQAYADFPFYYGNLVIIEHRFPSLEVPVYTLYGHLSAVQTEEGAYVQAGDKIGAVGYTGVAEWSHLHFEVRLGENTYRHTRNPELWLRPHSDENDLPNGALGGRILDEFGTPIYIPNVVVEKLGPDSQVIETLYVETYADFSLNGDDQWGENFAIGDLSPGLYRISFVARGLQTWEINVLPGALTILTFDARQP
jgi:murein DD-endopeptidase MepM/ murein hydrolase activator NlpD